MGYCLDVEMGGGGGEMKMQRNELMRQRRIEYYEVKNKEHGGGRKTSRR